VLSRVREIAGLVHCGERSWSRHGGLLHRRGEQRLLQVIEIQRRGCAVGLCSFSLCFCGCSGRRRWIGAWNDITSLHEERIPSGVEGGGGGAHGEVLLPDGVTGALSI
jgi:hypothetical protein